LLHIEVEKKLKLKGPPPPLEWVFSPLLVSAELITTKGDESPVSAELITTKGDESPGSSRMGVIGALFPSEAVQDKLHSA